MRNAYLKTRFILVAWSLCAIAVCADRASPKRDYIIHWTSVQKDYSSTTRFSVGCLPYTTDCGVPLVTVDHFEICASKEIALKMANEIGAAPTQSEKDWPTISTLGSIPLPPKHGTVVAIYEAHKLALKIQSTEVPIPQPAKTETVTTVELAK